MAIQDLRFHDRKMVKNMIARCELENAVIDMDKDGYFVHSFTMPAWLAAMPETGQVTKAAPVEVKEKAAPKAKNENGACAQIRAWARANPEATPAEGVAQFPTLNASTVKIQMRKVRIGEV